LALQDFSALIKFWIEKEFQHWDGILPEWDKATRERENNTNSPHDLDSVPHTDLETWKRLIKTVAQAIEADRSYLKDFKSSRAVLLYESG
jgi:hypothetical protein